ncbi:MAG: flagellar biosynthesis protein FlhB [Beijerinckiaceae bacterium]|nr:flagellar biosynthesis protein FlhB [Beijerinckiaceae bacterium]MDO9441295.1 flagellar biosynthesis protein FlhB [Beijerinckiaceae bacterium]
MSDEDKDSKTEEPTEKKLEDAAEKGNDPISREAALFASLIALLIVLALLIKPAVSRLLVLLQYMLDGVGQHRIENGADVQTLFALSGTQIGVALLPIILVLMGFGLAAAFAQNMPRFVLSRIAPELSRINPMKGFSRVFGGKGLITFLKATLELAIVSVAVGMVLRSHEGLMINLMFMRPTVMPEEILTMMLRIVAGIAAAMALIVAGDLVWTRISWRKDLRMTKQEIKDETKQAEGDPMVKARLRSIALDRARKRMMAQVPRATLVIANPTHYAIAIRYVREEGGAPIVVAKGQDLIALKIREIAAASGIPVLEQKLLARSMYDLVEVDQAIPPEFYRAVAELIHFLSRKKTRVGAI